MSPIHTLHQSYPIRARKLRMIPYVKRLVYFATVTKFKSITAFSAISRISYKQRLYVIGSHSSVKLSTARCVIHVPLKSTRNLAVASSSNQ